MSILSPGESPKREEQVLVLAAGGLTDKEIAIRLGISPDTVGTYWRRILAKYSAASRTEVVAKYTEQRAQASVENLRYVNECLKLVADHMIEQAAQRGTLPGTSHADAILASAPDWILLIDVEGHVRFSNRPIPAASAFTSILTSEDPEEDLAALLATAAAEGAHTTLVSGELVPEALKGAYDVAMSPCLGEPVGCVVVSARRRL